jgi:hypothetical protein
VSAAAFANQQIAIASSLDVVAAYCARGAGTDTPCHLLLEKKKQPTVCPTQRPRVRDERKFARAGVSAFAGTATLPERFAVENSFCFEFQTAGTQTPTSSLEHGSAISLQVLREFCYRRSAF